ncbi:MAG: molecular chaperone HtpG, partial [Clostridia bacterium]|nr:molecular chaperone HtpG [Clostridia bacterium]
FGSQLKWGIYSSYGSNKDMLQDLILFKSSFEGKYATLKEYVSRMKDGQDKIYYAYGDTVEKIALLPQVESVIGHGYEVLYLTDDIDEFALQMLHTYSEKEFLNVCKENLDLADDEEKEKLKTENEQSSEMFSFMQASIGDDVSKVQFTNTLQNHPVSLSSEGNVSVGMEKILNKMPGAEDQHIKAEIVLEININHPLAAKLKELFENDKDRLATYSKILFAQARLVSGMSLDNPAEISSLVCDLML